MRRNIPNPSNAYRMRGKVHSNMDILFMLCPCQSFDRMMGKLRHNGEILTIYDE